MEGSDTPRTPAAAAHRRNTTVGLVLLAVIVLALLSLFLPFSTEEGGGDVEGTAADLASLINEDRYQVVFLSDGGLFFGRLKARDGSWFELKDAYFLRETPAAKDQEASQEVSSITERLEQPEDSMLLNANEVVQVENLQEDSRVAQAIKRLER